jgi:hypothetical protein
VLNNLTPYLTNPTISAPPAPKLTIANMNQPLPYYVIVVNDASFSGAPPISSGVLSTTGNTIIDYSTLTLPITSHTYFVLVLVQSMAPFVANIVVP